MVKKQVFELLSALCLYCPRGYDLALDALENYRVSGFLVYCKSLRYRKPLEVLNIRGLVYSLVPRCLNYEKMRYIRFMERSVATDMRSCSMLRIKVQSHSPCMFTLVLLFEAQFQMRSVVLKRSHCHRLIVDFTTKARFRRRAFMS